MKAARERRAPVVLLLGQRDDRLLSGVRDRLVRLGRRAVWLTEADLLERTAFALRWDGRSSEGRIGSGDAAVALRDVRSVLARLPGGWRPGASFDPREREFVLHETLAAWWGVLACLPVPRLGACHLAAWLHDPAYAAWLGRTLARALGMAEPTVTAPPATRGKRGAGETLFIVGDSLVPASRGASEVLARIDGRRSALRRWQRREEVFLARLDFERREGLCLLRVDPEAGLEGVSAAAREAMASEAVRWLAA